MESKSDHHWFEDFFEESDCGCVLIGQAMLEERLGDLIRLRILSSSETTKDFLDYLCGRQVGTQPPNPFISFKSCIDYAQGRKLITKPMAEVLRQINALRVVFAHYKPPRHMKLTAKQVNPITDLLPESLKERVAHLWPLAGEKSRKMNHSLPRQVFLVMVYLLYVEIGHLLV